MELLLGVLVVFLDKCLQGSGLQIPSNHVSGVVGICITMRAHTHAHIHTHAHTMCERAHTDTHTHTTCTQIANNKRYAGNKGWTVSECAERVSKEIGNIDILCIHVLHQGRVMPCKLMQFPVLVGGDLCRHFLTGASATQSIYFRCMLSHGKANPPCGCLGCQNVANFPFGCLDRQN
eukprot:scaffold198585_cov20-Tisochrysis_lutea.AAC.1